MWTRTDICYLALLSLSCSISGYFGLMRGRGPSSPSALVLVRLCLFFLFWYPIHRLNSVASVICLLYLPSYIDLSELSGARISSSFRNGIIAKFVSDYFGCSLVRTTEIASPQCILALHPHGILPFGAIVNICTNFSSFETKFPTLVNRVVVAATMVSLTPLFRDVVTSLGVTDCSRYNFEELLRKGRTVGVFVGGAHEALYSNNSDEEILDLRRKKGFLRLSIMHAVPVVPCYTFNEVNHYNQLSHQVLDTIYIVAVIRRFFNRVSGLIAPVLLNVMPSKGSHVVTVVGSPLVFKTCSPLGVEPSDSELEAAMDRYVEALSALYSEHAPKYSSSKTRKLVIS